MPPLKSSTTLVGIAAAILTALYQLLADTSGPAGPCPNPSSPNDEILINGIPNTWLSSHLHALPCHAFSESYHEARSKFRHAASKLGDAAELHILPVVPGLPDYTTDIVVVPGGEEAGLVVHSSGCHGVEGFAGSAVQVAFLEHAANAQLSSSISLSGDMPTIVLVHVMNPFGMAHYRRNNENNVDLNRNALRPEEWDEVLRRDPNVASYDDFDAVMFNPPHAPTAFGAYVTVYVRSAVAILRHGFVNMKRSLVTGQYHKPRGVFFGGTELQPSHRLLHDFLRDRGYLQDGRTTAVPVTWIDVHTGLGPSGIDTLLAHGSAPTRENLNDVFAGAPRPVQYNFGLEQRPPSADSTTGNLPDDSSDVTAGYDLSRGIMNEYYAGLFPETARPLVVAQEFGSRSGVLVARGVILENMAFWHADPEDRQRWAEFSRDAFYVRTDRWRRSVLDRGLTVLRQAIQRSMVVE